VSPAVLAMFGLSPSFGASGSVSMTFAQDSVKDGTLTAVIGGGTVMVTGLPVREFASLLNVGPGLLMFIAVRRHKTS
jgi:hypothetical protein